MIETLQRQWLMLRMIPRHPRRIDAPTIRAHLEAQGIRTTLRTTQRDLNNLCTVFPLDFDSARPQGWCWRKGASQIDIPGMDPHAALAFSFVEAHASRMLPKSTLSCLAPWFRTAHEVMKLKGSALTSWPSKVRVIPHTLTTFPTQVAPEIQAVIFEALLLQRQVAITYKAISNRSEEKSYEIHPLTLVVRDRLMYLVCTAKKYEKPIFLALHRMTKAKMLESRAIEPKKLDIDGLITKELGVPISNAKINVKLRVCGALAAYLQEAPMDRAQKVIQTAGGWLEIEAKVEDTAVFRNWLMSLGANAVVIAPKSLNRALFNEAKSMCDLYLGKSSAVRN